MCTKYVCMCTLISHVKLVEVNKNKLWNINYFRNENKRQRMANLIKARLWALNDRWWEHLWSGPNRGQQEEEKELVPWADQLFGRVCLPSSQWIRIDNDRVPEPANKYPQG